MELAVYNIEGKDTSKKVVLDDALFPVVPNDHAIYLDVKQILANRRQGTHKTKEKWEVSLSTKKLKRQKGTGGARAGSLKSPVFVGGGRAFGPQPRDYASKLNKKVKALARMSALAYKVTGEKFTVVENFTFDAPKTKEYAKIAGNLSLSGKKVLVVLPEQNINVYLSARNLPEAKVVLASELNTYDIMTASHLLVMEGAIDVINTMYGLS